MTYCTKCPGKIIANFGYAKDKLKIRCGNICYNFPNIWAYFLIKF